MELASRKKGMENIIKFWSLILKENPDFNINFLYDAIYKNVVRWYDTEEELKHDNNECGNFSYWTDYFLLKSNINVYINPTWNYFIQFMNREKELYDTPDQIKLYIPMNSATIKDGVTKLFDFLASNDIIHTSKIGKNTRFDNVIVRVTNEEDVKKILKFIDENEDIKSGMLPPNPFAYSENNVAIVVDGKMSYNATIISYISLYLIECKNNNTLDSASYDDFIKFVEQYYNDVFINKINANRVYEDFNINQNSVAYKVNNIRQITNLFLNSNKEDFNLDSLFTHFKNNCDEAKNKKEELEYFYALVRDKIDTDDVEELISYSINTLSQKVTNDEAIIMLDSYIKTGNPAYISRISGLRNYLIENNFRDKVLVILETEGLSFAEYYASLFVLEETGEVVEDKVDIIEEEKQVLMADTSEEQELYTKTKEEYLIEAIMETYDKFEKKHNEEKYEFNGKEHVSLALFQLVALNNHAGFTNTTGSRDRLQEHVSGEDAINIILDTLKYKDIDTTDKKIQENITKEYVKYIVDSHLLKGHEKVK